MKKAILFNVFLLVLNVAFGQQSHVKRPDGITVTTASVDKIVLKLMDTAEVSGLCLGIIDNNKVAYVKGYGFKNKAKGKMNDTS
ncbi:MAG TPA: hypothetical protein VF622_19810, partial [Segetibacter sp.]